MKATAIKEFSAQLDQVRDVVDDIRELFQEEFDEKSEKWQESESGEIAQGRIDAIQAVIDAIDEAMGALQ
jgi:hypothetical protein